MNSEKKMVSVTWPRVSNLIKDIMMKLIDSFQDFQYRKWKSTINNTHKTGLFNFYQASGGTSWMSQLLFLIIRIQDI